MKGLSQEISSLFLDLAEQSARKQLKVFLRMYRKESDKIRYWIIECLRGSWGMEVLRRTEEESVFFYDLQNNCQEIFEHLGEVFKEELKKIL